MLIEFSATNFRSLLTRQTLTMVASADSTLAECNLIEYSHEKLRLNRQTAIYGANAAGKSNLLMGIEALRMLVSQSAGLQEGQPLLWIIPFRLGPSNEPAETEFEIIFVAEGIRYHYAVAATSTRIYHEWLVAYPQGRPQRWFERKYDVARQQEDWKFGPRFVGDRSQHKLWQNSTRSNALFLSTAVQLNNDQLKPAFHWITQQLIVILPGKVDFNPGLSLDLLRTPVGHDQLMRVLTAADVGIDRMELEEGSNSLQGSGLLRWARVIAWHTTSEGMEIPFDLTEESDGTRALFQRAGGLIKALESGATLCVDEIDRSLHPHLTRFLVKLFRSETNPKNAQMIFTTHDSTLLDPELLRRDQIWFVEKNQKASHFYSLLDFSPRKGDALGKGYLMGRYGAIPFVGDL